jgi:hypothetical protein
MSWKPKLDLAVKLEALVTSAKDAGGGRLAFLPACCTHKERNKGDSWVGVRHSGPENTVQVKSVYLCRESYPGAGPELFFTGGGGMTLELCVFYV